MNEQIIKTASVTHAFKARDILLENKIRSEIIKTPKEISSCGCGYSLKLEKSADIDKAKRILSDRKILMLEKETI